MFGPTVHVAEIGFTECLSALFGHAASAEDDVSTGAETSAGEAD